MKKVMDSDPAGQKSTDPTGSGSSSSSLQIDRDIENRRNIGMRNRAKESAKSQKKKIKETDILIIDTQHRKRNRT